MTNLSSPFLVVQFVTLSPKRKLLAEYLFNKIGYEVMMKKLSALGWVWVDLRLKFNLYPKKPNTKN
jgi:hypothetical protein